MKANTVCFFGHRDIKETEELKFQLCETIEKLIIEMKVDTFLFGSKSRFNDLCYRLVTEYKEKHPHIKRVYVRAEYPYIDDNYTKYLLESYEQTYYPEKIIGAGKAVYIKRNFEMIDKSEFCVVYYDENYSPTTRKSGTKIALEYSIKKNRYIIMFPKA